MTDIWWSPGEIRFAREEMIWLITWLSFLEDGKWPPDHNSSSSTRGRRSHKAPFENPSGFAGEVNSRLKTTGEAGEALVDEIQSGITDYEGLSRPAKRALNYVSGWRRRRKTYALWKAQKKYKDINLYPRKQKA